jgi:hypothetical protein
LLSVFYLTLGKAFFAECRGFAECFLFGSRRSLICRAPEKKRSAKPPALGKEADSGSVQLRVPQTMFATRTTKVHLQLGVPQTTPAAAARLTPNNTRRCRQTNLGSISTF